MHHHPAIDTLLNSLHHPSLKAISPGLERVHALLGKLGSPQQRLPPVIHIAGTNGKGSTAAYLTAILQHAGLRVHRYTSPHLVRFNERILLADKEISDDTLLHALTQVAEASRTCPVTFFEATTAAAFLAFADTPAEVCVLETGMGGRLDATNVVEAPLLTIITPISIDHAEYLGSTLEKIAAEKAGIMKTGVPCVIARQPESVLNALKHIAREKDTPLMVYGKDWTVDSSQYVAENTRLPLKPALSGNHQYDNAALALAACAALQRLRPDWKLELPACAESLPHAVWPARLQRLYPPHPYATTLPNACIWLDGGHNAAAALALADWLVKQPGKRLIICGMLGHKDAEGFISRFSGVADRMIFVDGFTHEETHPATHLTSLAAKRGVAAIAASNMENALSIAGAHADIQTLLICGSLYLAGAVLSQSGT